jgi:4-diphosphocytidyl-2-C-methyl-D-erythritol kinase
MQSYSLTAAAKINLYLEILGARPDGYHNLAMVLQSIDLADQIDLRSLKTNTICVHCDHPEVPQDHTNLAYKAAALMAENFSDAFAKFGGVDITIKKRIPVGAGLAGGSTNAAAVLVGLNLMWDLKLSEKKLQYFGSLLGSDVPFCISGGTVLATEKGESLAALSPLNNPYIVLAKYRNLSVSTAWAYQTFHDRYLQDDVVRDNHRQKVHLAKMLSAIDHQNERQIGELLYNDLERVVLPQYPQVQRLRSEFQRLGCDGMMSGSGSSVFALTNSKDRAQQIVELIKIAIPDPDLELWISQFTAASIRVASLLK